MQPAQNSLELAEMGPVVSCHAPEPVAVGRGLPGNLQTLCLLALLLMPADQAQAQRAANGEKLPAPPAIRRVAQAESGREATPASQARPNRARKEDNVPEAGNRDAEGASEDDSLTEFDAVSQQGRAERRPDPVAEADAGDAQAGPAGAQTPDNVFEGLTANGNGTGDLAGEEIAPKARALFERGEALLKAGRKEDALRKFFQAGNVSRNYFEAYYEAGKLALELKQFDTAAQLMGLAISIDERKFKNDSDKRTPDTYLLNAKALSQSGNAQAALQAIEDYEQLSDDSESVEFLLQTGVAYRELGAKKQALDYLKQAVEADPKSKDAAFALGLAYYRFQQEEDAVVYLSKSLELTKPEDKFIEPLVARSAAQIRLAKKSPGSPQAREALLSAEADCDQVLENEPDSLDSLYNRALARRLLGKRDQAIEGFTAALGKALNERTTQPAEAADIHFQRGIVWYEAGQVDLAAGDFKDGLALNANDLRLYLWLGMSLARQGRHAEAISAYNSALIQNPNFDQVLLNRGLAFLHLNLPERAIDDINGYIRIKPGDGVGHAYRAYALLQLKQRSAASQAFQKAISLSPQVAATKIGERLQSAGL